MGFPSVFLFCTKKITWFVWRNKKISSRYGDKTTIFYMVYMEPIMEENIFPRLCTILTKIEGVSIFVSIPHCPMDYCIPPYSTILIEQGFACNSVE